MITRISIAMGLPAYAFALACMWAAWTPIPQ